jgi:outer membrane lipase/esterase
MTTPQSKLTLKNPVHRVLAFGDSLTDSGSFAGITATGRFTTPGGQMWCERVAEALGHSLTPARVFRNGAFHEAGGHNHAQSGARAIVDPGLHDGLSWSFKRQIDEVLRAGALHTNDVVLVTIGGPDVLFALMSVQQQALTPEGGMQAAQSAAVDCLAQLQRLLQAGVERVLFANVGDFGRVPAFGSGQGPVAAFASQMAQAFNATLLQGMNSLAPEAVLLDAFAVFGALLDRPAEFGISNTTDQAFDPARTPATVTGTAPNGLVEHLVRPDAGQTFLFADFVHPTAVGHRVMADAALVAAQLHWA